MSAYYNEIDKHAAAWLRTLIAAGHIAPGDVDERSILDVQPDDLRGYTQCHFFAGIGVWSYALRRAGWADDRPVWTGSCPCQPFSAAGKGNEFGDERHLWPAWFRLIRECRPVACFGEQVASKDALAWLDHVSTDLEGEGYAIGAVDTCAAGVGAPHIRQRLYFVADTAMSGAGEGRLQRIGQQRLNPEGGRHHGGEGNDQRPADGNVGHAQQPGLEGHGGDERNGDKSGRQHTYSAGSAPSAGDAHVMGDSTAGGFGIAGGSPWDPGQPAQPNTAGGGAMGYADGSGLAARDTFAIGTETRPGEFEGPGLHNEPGATNGFWSDAQWIPCRDGKARAVEPGSPPLVTGAAARVVRLRGYGNSINAVQAQEFISAYRFVRGE